MRESKNNRDINISANHAYNHELYKKFDMDNFISPEEEDYIRKQTKKKQEANERCTQKKQGANERCMML